MTDPLRPFWNFDDLDATEQRFHVLQAEIGTQLARVQGLRGDFDEGDRLLDEAAATSAPVVEARVALERGRLRRSSGDETAALPLFERAFAIASDAGETFLAVDAAHMAAIVAGTVEDREQWASRGLALAEASDQPDVRRWRGSLWNNLGWGPVRAGGPRRRAGGVRAGTRRLRPRRTAPARAVRRRQGTASAGKGW